MAYNLWDRQVDETSKGYALFAHYRDLGPFERSYSRVAREFSRSIQAIETLSRRHNWAPRAQAWDQENERVKRAAQIKGLESLARRQVLTGQLMMGKGIKRIQNMSDEEVMLMSLWEASRLVDLGQRLERAGYGEPEPMTFSQQISVSVGESTIIEILRRNPTRVGPIVAKLDELRQLVPELSMGPLAGGSVYYEGDATEIEDADLFASPAGQSSEEEAPDDASEEVRDGEEADDEAGGEQSAPPEGPEPLA